MVVVMVVMVVVVVVVVVIGKNGVCVALLSLLPVYILDSR